LNQELSHDAATKTHDRRYQLRNFSPQTQRTYVHHIAGLAQFYQTSPEHLDLEDLRQYQVYLAGQCRYSAESLNQFVSAAKFLYGVTLEAPFDAGVLLRARVGHHVPIILSQQEVELFFQNVPSLRNRAGLMVAYGAGASPKWWRSRWRTSTRNGCCCASRTARGDGR